MELLLSYEQNEIMSGWERIESRGLATLASLPQREDDGGRAFLRRHTKSVVSWVSMKLKMCMDLPQPV
jgi:hypothetical protein